MTWRSKKQQIIVGSSVEAEFWALAHGICEGIWLKRLLIKLRIETECPIEVICEIIFHSNCKKPNAS